jgi:hypothetical protein
MKYMAKMMNQTGEDWTEVALQLSSASPIGEPIVLPRPNNPWVLDNKRAAKSAMNYENAGVQGVYQSSWGVEDDIEKLKGVNYENISVPSFLKARELQGRYSIPSNGTIFTLPILSQNISADFYYYGYPSLDPEVFLVAELSGWSSLGLIDGVADISYGGNEIGRSLIRWSEVQDTLMLPIGLDNSVFMERAEMADQKYFKETWSSRKRKSTLAFEFTIKNNNPFPIDFQLYDQIPLSQTRSADVDIETLSKGKLDDSSGEVLWEINLAQNESSVKQLIYTIDMDAGYSYSRSGYGSKAFRTISCPSF